MKAMQGELTMTYREIDRHAIIRQYLDKKITQRQAAMVLGLSTRQLRRLTRQFQQAGVEGLISKHRHKPSNNHLPNELKELALSHIRHDFYDYGPTLAAEKLNEYHNIKISKETAREWMIEAGIWRAHQKRIPRLHPSRERRSCLGELLQIDGSDHDWFEGRAPRCTLLVFIDDATSNILKLLFCNDETTLNYFTAFMDYVLRYGAPRSLYNDKHGVFKVNHPEAMSGNGLTQFGRVLECLGIEEIFANSPQAKGRVERANGILQDRLVKALRYHKISDIESANVFAEEFRLEYNRKFAKPANNPVDMHRALTEGEKQGLNKLFSIQTKRVISKDMLVRFENTIYKINEPEQVRRLRQAPVLVCENINGEISIYHQDKALHYEVYRTKLHADQLLNRAGVNSYLNQTLRLEQLWHPTLTPSSHTEAA
jgi:hypothetical protein